ncbi:MAG TPA: class III extradiol ring-cleavage dioxygenase [Stellaceae bacterium]|nr:class III extradiol ring-cleavage dioxygenase [Stellaceae bacterium]
MSAVLPTYFVSHGSPTLALDPGATGAFWEELGQKLPRPDAVLCVSAHWMTTTPAVSLAAQPETIHDFYGFPAPLYEIRYPAPGAPALAERAATLLEAAGIATARDPGYGLDHGAWVPLRSMYAAADLPVTQLAIQPRRDAGWHHRMGEALAPLRREGVLVLASGGAVHNLRAVDWRGGTTPGWAMAFDQWLAGALAVGDTEALIAWERTAPNARQAHPTEDHFLPLFVALGAAGKGARGKRIHDGFTLGSLSMAAFEIGG